MPDLGSTETAAWEGLCEHFRELALLSSMAGLLSWDQQTKLPTRGAAFRAKQISHVTGLIHSRRTDNRVGDWLTQLEASEWAASPESDQGSTVRGLRRVFDRATRLPQSLVEALAENAVLGQAMWEEARKQNDFRHFAPQLTRILDLKREEAQALEYGDVLYDSLLDRYEPGARVAWLRSLLSGLRDALVPLVEEIAGAPHSPRDDLLHRHYPRHDQEQFALDAARGIGFDFDRGRLDVTYHPFCGGAGPDDVRITTRYDEQFFSTAFFGVLHEAGHGLYEQGLRGEWYGLPPGQAASLGVHESQSRLWENQVGRSRPYWEALFPAAQQRFPAALADADCEEFYQAVNVVRPTLIRVEADEVTYNLHILIRFELECALLERELTVDDLPAAWNEKYKAYLGVVPDREADGVLQDVHWSAGLVGYFPTYSLGNLYAAQLYEQAERQLGDLASAHRQGDFRPLLEWLQQQVHARGECDLPHIMMERISGEAVSHEPLMRALRRKYSEIYGLS